LASPFPNFRYGTSLFFSFWTFLYLTPVTFPLLFFVFLLFTSFSPNLDEFLFLFPPLFLFLLSRRPSTFSVDRYPFLLFKSTAPPLNVHPPIVRRPHSPRTWFLRLLFFPPFFGTFLFFLLVFFFSLKTSSSFFSPFFLSIEFFFSGARTEVRKADLPSSFVFHSSHEVENREAACPPFQVFSCDGCRGFGSW